MAAAHRPDAVTRDRRYRFRPRNTEEGLCRKRRRELLCQSAAPAFTDQPTAARRGSVLASAPFVGVGFYDLVVDPKKPSILYAATTNGFYKSTNSGGTWSLKRAGRCWDISVHPRRRGGRAAGRVLGRPIPSTNGGNTFTAVTLPSAPRAAWTRLAVDRVADGARRRLCVRRGGEAAHLWRRGGTTWTKITVPRR